MNPELISSIGSIAAIAPLDGVGSNINDISNISNAAQVAGSDGAGDSFGNWFALQLNQVNGQLLTVDKEMQTVALGGTQSLHQFMIHMEEAKLSFQLLAQVRNHLLESYQEVMRMQV